MLPYSQIFTDFMAGKSPAVDYFVARSLEQVATELDQHSYHREQLVEILRRQNAGFKASDKTMRSIDKLADQRAVCVFTGQQAGLFGGPLLTLIKAMGVVKSAATYAEQLDRPVIPIFWIAGDDHDFEEANHTYVLTRSGEICKNSYQTAPEFELPTADIKLDDSEELARLKSQLRECLGETDFTDDLFSRLDQAYSTEDTLVTAFGKWMADLTREFGLVLFSPGDMEAKRMALPFFLSIIEKQDVIHDQLLATNQSLEANGYHIQVEKKENAAHLFYNLDGRKPVSRQGGSYEVGARVFSQAELINELNDHPERFSPDVMTRPLLQSYLFPVLAQKGGPAEIAYLAQINSLFASIGIPAPVHQARPTLTVVERRLEQQMADMSIQFEDLLGDIEQVVNRVLSRTFPPDLHDKIKALKQALEAEFDKVSDDVLAFDEHLQKNAEQTRGKIDYLLSGFEAKVFAAHKKKSQQTRDRIYRINNLIYPRHGLQERSINITYFLARYGDNVIQYIYDQIDAEQTSHQLISLAEFGN